MERKRPYWQVAVSLVFSILATAAFIILGVKAIGFLMPFVVGWIISAIATPLVNWLEKRLKIVKKLGTVVTESEVLSGVPEPDSSDCISYDHYICICVSVCIHTFKRKNQRTGILQSNLLYPEYPFNRSYQCYLLCYLQTKYRTSEFHHRNLQAQ